MDVDGRMYGWVHVWMDGWMDGWPWMDGWMDDGQSGQKDTEFNLIMK